MKRGISLAPGIEISYVIRDARKWEVDPERTASKFDSVYYRELLEKAWGEAAFVWARVAKSQRRERHRDEDKMHQNTSSF
jgi:hypothetical protein